jgi:hypothetical protein
MGRAVPLRPVAVGLAVLGAVGGPGAGALPPAQAAGLAAKAPAIPSAAPLLIGRSALGPGWTVSAAAPRSVASLACPQLHARLSGAAVAPSAAASPTFADGSSGPFVTQTAYRYASATVAARVWRAVDRSALERCLARTLTEGTSAGVSFQVTGARRLAAPALRGPSVGGRRLPVAVEDARFRIAAVGSSGGAQTDVWLDAVLVHAGPAISELAVSSAVTVPPARLEERLARAIAARSAS